MREEATKQPKRREGAQRKAARVMKEGVKKRSKLNDNQTQSYIVQNEVSDSSDDESENICITFVLYATSLSIITVNTGSGYRKNWPHNG